MGPTIGQQGGISMKGRRALNKAMDTTEIKMLDTIETGRQHGSKPQAKGRVIRLIKRRHMHMLKECKMCFILVVVV